jgi:hypothetical protein
MRSTSLATILSPGPGFGLGLDEAVVRRYRADQP